jgi:hypothetical protein
VHSMTGFDVAPGPPSSVADVDKPVALPVFGGLPVHAAQGAAALFPAPVDQMPWAHITAVLDDLGSREAVLVEPSTSVNRKVTTPEGAAARSADTPAESHNRPLLPRTSADPARSPDPVF